MLPRPLRQFTNQATATQDPPQMRFQNEFNMIQPSYQHRRMGLVPDVRKLIRTKPMFIRKRCHPWSQGAHNLPAQIFGFSSNDETQPPRPAPPPPPCYNPNPGPSSTSGSGSNMEYAGTSEIVARLLNILECPVCMDYISPPIQQCREGHLVCNKCRPQLNCCPKCRQGFVEVRARALEQIAEAVPYPCYNNGCGAMPTLAERQAHEAICPYREYPCPIDNCNWAGSRSSVAHHMSQHHKSLFITSSNHEVSLNVMNDVTKSFIMNCYEEIFQCVMGLDFSQEVFVGAITYLGPRNNAKDYEFELKFKSNVPPYTSVTVGRTVLEETQSPPNQYGMSSVIISFTTLREIIHEVPGRPSSLQFNVSISKRTNGLLTSQPSANPASPTTPVPSPQPEASPPEPLVE